MAGRRGSCGVRNHGHKKDIKLSGMSDGSRVYSENLGEDASLLAMRGSGDRNNRSDGKDEKILEMGGPSYQNERVDRNNRSDGKDEKILEMGGPSYQNERVEDEQLVEDEEEEEMEVEQLDEKEQIKKYKMDQSRSHFAMVRRKFRIGGQSSGRWCVQVRRPVELMGAKSFTCSEYDTDVEAAVAASVVARVFNKAVQRIRSPEKKPKRLKPPFKCHDYLIYLTHGSRLPDSFENNDIREFVKPCVELFVKIAKDVENKIQPMPQDPGMAKAIKCYQEAVRYDHEYQERKVPPLKQVRRGENKRKRNLVESDGAASGANGPTSRVRR